MPDLKDGDDSVDTVEDAVLSVKTFSKQIFSSFQIIVLQMALNGLVLQEH